MLKKLITHLCYPLLLASGIGSVALAFRYELNYGLVNSMFLLWVIAYLALMEQILPYDKKWLAKRSDFPRYAIYLFITMLGGALAVMATYNLALLFKAPRINLKLFFEIPVALLLSSLGSYLFHRLSHIWPWLWRFHGIHHLEKKVNVANNGVNHFFDVFGRRLLAQAPIVILGFSTEALFILGIFNTIQGYFSHANIKINLGFFNYIIVTPEQHRLHHSRNLSEAGHFSVDIPFWDLCFKSYTWRPGLAPKSIGVVSPQKFPSPASIYRCLLFPFFRQKT